ncbi:MAG TPA: hypothetical protein VGO78_12895 [Acidimicrobiales bacterium]|nr:hypothetical protein [Acidimicrobiales bacterium]
MSGRSRRWVCCLAALLLMAASAWWAHGGAAAPVARGDQVVQAPAEVHDASTGAASLHSRRAAIEPAAAKRVEFERLVAVAAAATVLVLGLAVAGPAAARAGRRRHPGVCLRRPRGPPLSFVS